LLQKKVPYILLFKIITLPLYKQTKSNIMQTKANITIGSKQQLMSFAKQNEELKVLYYECDDFKPLKEWIDNHFIYTQEQLDYLKEKFVASR
jgi:hypothetical protein